MRSISSTSLVLARVIALGCNFAVSALAARLFSLDYFGIWALITPLPVLVLSLDFGVANAVRNGLAIKPEVDGRDLFVTGALLLMLLACVLALIALVVGGTLGFGFFFNTTNTAVKQLGSALFLVTLVVSLVRMPLYLGVNSFFSYREPLLNAAFDTGIWVAVAFMLGIAKLYGLDIFSTAMAFLAVSVLGYAIALATFWLRRGWVLFVPDQLIHKFVTLIREALPFGGLQFTAMIVSYSSMFVVSTVINIADTGPFKAAMSIFLAVSALQMAYIMPFWSEYSFLYKENKFDKIFSLLRRTVTFTLFLLPPMLVLAMMGPFIIRLWLRIPYENWAVFLFLGLGTFLQIVSNTISMLFNGTGMPEITTRASISGAAVILPSTYLLGQFMGVDGVALGMALSSCTSVLVMWWNVDKIRRRFATAGVV